MSWRDDNYVLIHGRLVADPELSHTQTNTACCNFTVANNRGKSKSSGEDLPANFFQCVAWGKPAEMITEMFSKGKKIHITGCLIQNRWTDEHGNKRSSVKVQVYSFAPIEGKKKDADQHDS